ncbi:MAG: metal ABC transporter permease [Pseudomonadota bacterium]
MIEAWILEPLSFEFIRRALVVGCLVAVSAGLLSAYLVLKGWSLMGDAVAHGVLPGIVIAYLVGAPLALGAFVAGMVCAVSVGYISERCRVKEDTVMGVVFSGMFALGLVMYTRIESEVHLNHILFGDMLGVEQSDMIESIIIATVVATLVLLRRRDLTLYAFDSQHARAVGVPVTVLHYGLLVLLSLTIVAALKAVGLILSIALLIAPGAIAYLLTTRLDRMLFIAPGCAVCATVLGVLTSFRIDSAPAPTVVLWLLFFFVLAFLFAPRSGILRQRNSSSVR